MTDATPEAWLETVTGVRGSFDDAEFRTRRAAVGLAMERYYSVRAREGA